MSDEVLIKRYADAFVACARESIGIEKALADLQGVSAVFRDNPDFANFLRFPDIDYAEKHAVIEKVIDGYFSQEIVRLLKLLVEKGRIGFFSDIAEYARSAYAHGAAKEGVVISPYPLEQSFVDTLREGLEKALNLKLHFYTELDPGLLGGVLVRIGNVIYDGSVRRRLEDVKYKLTALKVA